jgi:hypothetical protein
MSRSSASTSQQQELTALIADRDRYREWLQKLAEQKGEIADGAYTRVQLDYHARLTDTYRQLAARLDGMRALLDTRRSELRNARIHLQEKTDELAEAELRFRVGEYDDRRWDQIQRTVTGQIEAAERRHEELVAQVADLEATLAQVESAASGADDFDDAAFVRALVGSTPGVEPGAGADPPDAPAGETGTDGPSREVPAAGGPAETASGTSARAEVAEDAAPVAPDRPAGPEPDRGSTAAAEPVAGGEAAAEPAAGGEAAAKPAAGGEAAAEPAAGGEAAAGATAATAEAAAATVEAAPAAAEATVPPEAPASSPDAAGDDASADRPAERGTGRAQEPSEAGDAVAEEAEAEPVPAGGADGETPGSRGGGGRTVRSAAGDAEAPPKHPRKAGAAHPRRQVQCPNCGVFNIAGTRFCEACGAAL